MARPKPGSKSRLAPAPGISDTQAATQARACEPAPRLSRDTGGSPIRGLAQPDGDVLVTAGIETSGSFGELYSPATGQWSSAGSPTAAGCTAALDCRFASSATLLGTGEVLVAGGLIGTDSNPGSTPTAVLYNPAANTWTTTGSMTTGRIDQTTNLLTDGQVLVAGGESFGGHARTLLASAELYTP
jgi:large repetitive protein